jgi:hypothetical protein
MHIHQLNIQYLPEQDRMLFRVNTNPPGQFGVWLTRRLCVGLLPVLRKVVADQAAKTLAASGDADSGMAAKDPQVRALLSEFANDKALQQSDFKTPFQATADEDAVLVSAMLVTEVQVTPLANGNLKLKFLSKLTGLAAAKPEVKQEVKQMEMELNPQLRHGLLHLLETAFTNAKWGADSVGAGADLPDPHALVEKRPTYLN